MELIQALKAGDAIAAVLEEHGVAGDEEKELMFYDYLHGQDTGLDGRLAAINYASSGNYGAAERVVASHTQY